MNKLGVWIDRPGLVLMDREVPPTCEAVVALGDTVYGTAKNLETADVLISNDLAALKRFTAQQNKNAIFLILPTLSKSRSSTRLPDNASYLQWQGPAITAKELDKLLRTVAACHREMLRHQS